MNVNFNFKWLVAGIALVTLFFIASCDSSSSILEPTDPISANMETVDPLAKTLSDCQPVVEQLRAGQTIDIGNISIWDNGESLFVQFNAENGWELQHTHVNISADNIVVDGEVINPNDGRPAPGQYTVQTAHDPRVTTFTYAFSLADYQGDEIYVLTHAEAISPNGGGETAYGGDLENTGKGWWYYSVYHEGDGCNDGDNPDDDDDNNGPVETYNLNGNVFFDVDSDGLFDSNELGIGGIIVELVFADGSTVQTVTNPDGSYSFTDLPNGNYTVVVDPDGSLNGLIATTDENQNESIQDTDINSVIFGYELPSISGSVFWDENSNTLFDNSEKLFSDASIKVQLLDAFGNVVQTTVIDENGNYSFDVYPGDYTVVVDPDGLLDGLTSSTGESLNVTVGFTNVVDLDFGYELPTISGTVFYDITGNGVQGVDEPGIDGVTVSLVDENGNVIETIVTDSNGNYEFDVYPGNYTVIVEDINGLDPTTQTSVSVAVGFADETVDFGFDLDLSTLSGQVANGFTIGFWKNNLQKAISGKTKGIQVDANLLQNYTNQIAGFAIEPFNDFNMTEAYNVLSANGSDAVLLLEKQLLGSEYNYMNGAFIGGNELVTELFVYYGEYLVKHAEEFSRDELLEAKDWYDAYNNSHGGPIL